MRQVPISQFKATCLALLEDVRATGEPIIVTRRGVPIAQVGPAGVEPLPKRRLGGMAGTIRFLGDIVEPVFDPDDIEALR